MDAADDLELKWLHLDPSQAGAGSLSGMPAGHGGANPAGRSERGDLGERECGDLGERERGERGPGGGAAGPGDERLDRHGLSNAVTAIAGAARLLCDRWDELGEAERKELAAMVLRRSDELRRALEGNVTGGAAGSRPGNS